MKITQKAIDIIRSSVASTSVETGGIMGSEDGILISDIIMDIPNNEVYRCYYAPNVKFFNKCIADWKQQNIKF